MPLPIAVTFLQNGIGYEIYNFRDNLSKLLKKGVHLPKWNRTQSDNQMRNER